MGTNGAYLESSKPPTSLSSTTAAQRRGARQQRTHGASSDAFRRQGKPGVDQPALLGVLEVHLGNPILFGGRGTGDRPYAIGIDGSLYQHYPGFEERTREALRILLGEEVEKRVEMVSVKNGVTEAALVVVQLLNPPGTLPH
ncbi:hypothetical protein EDB83DRAFT_2532497 [Lactarius deliciosus]|nr:hypothetical protein EDB83DRAFT_2532497 [Lactarius deliciosus]